MAESQYMSAIELQPNISLNDKIKVENQISSILTDLHLPLKQLNRFPLNIDQNEVFSSHVGNLENLQTLLKDLLQMLIQDCQLFNSYNSSDAKNLMEDFFDQQVETKTQSSNVENWEQMATINSHFTRDVFKVFEYWHQKSNHSLSADSKFKSKQLKSINQALVQQIETAMKDPSRLIKKTQINREKISFLLNNEVPIESTQIYDDTDFYLSLVKQCDNPNGENQNDPEKIAARVTALKNSKIKKDFDFKASKGRKIKYEVFEKLTNFMAPSDAHSSLWSDEKRDEFFDALFKNSSKSASAIH